MILENKNILVTGGGKGIGFSSILEAEKEGAYVYAIIKSKKDSKKFKNIKNIKIFYGNVSDKKNSTNTVQRCLDMMMTIDHNGHMMNMCNMQEKQMIFIKLLWI